MKLKVLKLPLKKSFASAFNQQYMNVNIQKLSQLGKIIWQETFFSNSIRFHSVIQTICLKSQRHKFEFPKKEEHSKRNIKQNKSKTKNQIKCYAFP